MASCIIYNNKTYTEAEFQDLVRRNPEQFEKFLQNGTFQQMEGTESSVANEDTIGKVKEFLSRIGVELKTVADIIVNGTKISANGIADPLRRLVEVVAGKEDVALTEEAMHMAVELIQQKYPELYRQLFNKVGEYQLYAATLNAYRENPDYQINGRPDIIKIKKEAIAKVLAEYIIQENEGVTEKPELIKQTQGWWDKIVDALKKLFGSTNFNPFEATATNILSGDISGEVVSGGNGSFYQLVEDKGKDIFDRIKSTSITKVEPDGQDSYYEKSDGTRVLKRVTDRVKKFYEEAFRNKEMTEAEKQDAETKKEKGTDGHKDIETILGRYVDRSTGEPRRNKDGELVPLPVNERSNLNPKSWEMYGKLETYIKQLIESYPAGTRFMWEEIIYDPTEDEAGTIDFMAIQRDGVVDVQDWKFIDVNTAKTSDVPWYKKRAFNIQLSRYGKILKDVYSIKNQRKSRAIPIIPMYTRDTKTNELKLMNLEIAGENLKEAADFMLPVPSSIETTGNKKIDGLIGKLNAILQKVEKKQTKGQERLNQIKEAEALTSAIRKLQVTGETSKLISVAKLFLQEKQKLFKTYIKVYEEGKENTLSDAEVESISKQVLDAYYSLEAYKDINQVFRNVYDKNVPEEAKTLELLQDVADNADAVQDDLKELVEAMGERSIANRFGIVGLMMSEKVVGYLSRNFMRFSDARTKATQVLYKLINTQRQKAEIAFDEESTKLEKIKGEVDTWLEANGKEKLADMLFAKDANGNVTRNLSNKYASEFYVQLTEAQGKKDTDWMNANIDMDGYMSKYEESFNNYKNWADNHRFDLDDAKDEEVRAKVIKDFQEKYDIKAYPKTAFSSANDKLSFHPVQEKWYSKEYRQMLSNEPVLKLFDYMRRRNGEAHNIGLFKSYHATFFPQVRKNFIEGLTFGLNSGGSLKTALKTLGSNMGVQPHEFGYIDPLTGQPEDKIFARYMSDLAEVNEKGERDYTQVSDDIFNVLTLWNYEMAKYQYMTEIESRSKVLHLLEGSKKRIVNIKDGEIEYANSNEQNTKYFKNFMDYALYDKKLAADQDDFGFTVPYNKLADKVNKFFGKDIMPKSENPEIQMSAVKMVNNMNRWFQLKTLGLNLTTSISNYFGGNINLWLNSGKDLTRKDFWSAQQKLTSARFYGKEGNAYAGLIQYFIPLMENHGTVKAREMSLSNAKKYLSSETLMVLMREADKSVQMISAIAYFDNTMVENGQLVNIREFVKGKPEYANIHLLPSTERASKREAMEREIEQLKSTRSLPNVVKTEGEKVIIEGIERQSETVYELRNRIQQFVKEALGSTTPEDVSQINMTLFGQSLMMFKNWIPSLVVKRFGSARYVAGKDEYDYGRFRAVVNVLREGMISGGKNLIAYMGGSDAAEDSLIKTAMKVYQRKVSEFSQRGDNFDISEAEFVEMYLRGVKTQMKEFMIMGSLLGLFFSVKAAVPDDDKDDRTKGMYKWAVRMLDKMTDEVAFFYNPISFEQIANGKIFPSVSILSDAVNFVQHGLKEIWLHLGGDEEGAEKNKVAKYILKDIPVMKEFLYYLAIFNKELADSIGVKITTESRRQ